MRLAVTKISLMLHLVLMGECRFPGCCKVKKSYGLCSGHAYQYKAGKELTEIVKGQTSLRNIAGDLRKCGGCERWLPFNNFNSSPTGANGLSTRCKLCQAVRFYRMSANDYLKLYQEQDGKCKICLTPEEVCGKLVVDHDHSCCVAVRKTNKYTCGKCTRGLLCQTCNKALGMFKESVEVLYRALHYVEVNNECEE